MAKKQSTEEKIVIGFFKALIWPFKVIFGRSGGVKKGEKIDFEMARRKWQEINALVQMNGESRWRGAVMEADKLLDYGLKARGCRGETMGERLKYCRNDFSRAGYEAAWAGHKLRNRYAHEMDADVLQFEAKGAIKNFEIALKDLRII